jgi:hypothetical protein
MPPLFWNFDGWALACEILLKVLVLFALCALLSCVITGLICTYLDRKAKR